MTDVARWLRHLGVVSFAAALLAGSLTAGASPLAGAQAAGAPPAQAAAPDVTRLGPQAGERVPDFRLPDQHGRERTLSSLMGPKGLVLVFSRSADW